MRLNTADQKRRAERSIACHQPQPSSAPARRQPFPPHRRVCRSLSRRVCHSADAPCSSRGQPLMRVIRAIPRLCTPPSPPLATARRRAPSAAPSASAGVWRRRIISAEVASGRCRVADKINQPMKAPPDSARCGFSPALVRRPPRLHPSSVPLSPEIAGTLSAPPSPQINRP